VQDQVELALMRSGEHDVARAYVLYRAKQMEERRAAKEAAGAAAINAPQIHVLENGERKPLELARDRLIGAACPAWKTRRCRRHRRRNPEEPVRRRAGRRAAQVRHPGRPRADGKGPGLLAGDRPHPAAHHPQGSLRQGSGARRRRIRDYFPQYIAKGIAAELLDTKLADSTWPAWPKPSSPTATCSSATSACRPCTTATSCTCATSASKCRRPSSCAWPWAWR
jgi:ribonucleoside-diphosphate reductase alpha chain